MAAFRGWGGEISPGSINIMEICNSSVPPPVRKCRWRSEFMRAEDLCMHAEMENLPAGNSLCQTMEEATERQKEQECYSVCAMDAFHTSLGDFRAGFVTG